MPEETEEEDLYDEMDRIYANEKDYSDQDEDEAYERMRDEQGDMLYEALRTVLKTFYNGKGYYGGSLSKLKQHSISTIESMTEERLKE